MFFIIYLKLLKQFKTILSLNFHFKRSNCSLKNIDLEKKSKNKFFFSKNKKEKAKLKNPKKTNFNKSYNLSMDQWR